MLRLFVCDAKDHFFPGTKCDTGITVPTLGFLFVVKYMHYGRGNVLLHQVPDRTMPIALRAYRYVTRTHLAVYVSTLLTDLTLQESRDPRVTKKNSN